MNGYAPTTPNAMLRRLWRGGWFLVVLPAALFLTHALTAGRYGYFRDELYYLAQSEHLAWGYVDHPPFSIAILALVRSVLGDSLYAVRLLPALAGAATVLTTALIARELGGSRFAQGLAGLTVLIAPAYLAMSGFYSMNAFDILFWSLCAFFLARILTTEFIDNAKRFKIVTHSPIDFLKAQVLMIHPLIRPGVD